MFMNHRILLLLILLLAGCSSKPELTQYKSTYAGQGGYRVYLTGHGWHTGLVLPTRELIQSIPELAYRFPHAEFIEIGWGDQGFYQAKDITIGLTLKALLWPTQTVIHAVAVPKDVAAYFANSEVIEICLNRRQLLAMIVFISHSFFRDQDGQVNPVKQGIYGDSQFYRGYGDYHMFNTCNTWTAKALSSAGFDISSTFTLTASSVIDQISRIFSGVRHQEDSFATVKNRCN